MMNFSSLQEAKKYVREMSVEETEEIGDASVMQYLDGGDIEIVAIGEECSDPSAVTYLGKVKEVLY
jgi:hypothetical protein